ncbi:MAG: hypothetical protein GEU90_15680 [Gemmatimonas sp.]|nr:hypothetical protein [Gemmatimonas sp.]
MTSAERDLQPLDPERDPVKWEAMVGSIMTAAQPELERRAVIRSPMVVLSEWFRPAVAATAAVAMVAASAVLFIGELPGDESAGPGIVAEGIGIPNTVADWLDTGHPDALDELVFGMEGEVQ